MLLRLVLVLVLAFAAPAMPAAAHGGAAPIAMQGHDMPGMDHKAPTPAQHFCIGCVPIGDWNAVRIAPPFLLPAPAPVGSIAKLPLLPGEAPLPPPPRIA